MVRKHTAPGVASPDRDVADDWLDLVEDRLRPLREVEKRKDANDRKTVDEVFDRSTLLTLYKFLRSGLFETIDYPISTGKEANVFHATARNDDSLAIKIFRTNTATFRSFMTYIHGDPRFHSVRHNRRDVVNTWCQKEFKNLQKLKEVGVPVPTPFTYQNNVLVMEFIGENRQPAPRLKDAPPEDPQAAYEDILADLALAYQDAKLVHGDASEFNILNRNGELVVIDVAQGVLTRHPMSRELLVRDVKNVCAYFRRLGVDTDPKTAIDQIAPPNARETDEDDEEGDKK